MNIFCAPANVVTSIEKDSLGDEFVLVDIESHETSSGPKKRSASMLAPERKSTSESDEGMTACINYKKCYLNLSKKLYYS